MQNCTYVTNVFCELMIQHPQKQPSVAVREYAVVTKKLYNLSLTNAWLNGCLYSEQVTQNNNSNNLDQKNTGKVQTSAKEYVLL